MENSKLQTISKLFEDSEIRSVWDSEKEEYYFSVVDVVGALTNEIYQEWSGMKASQYKEYKGIRKESLRDNMTDIEVVLTDLGEIATRELALLIKNY